MQNLKKFIYHREPAGRLGMSTVVAPEEDRARNAIRGHPAKMITRIHLTIKPCFRYSEEQPEPLFQTTRTRE